MKKLTTFLLVTVFAIACSGLFAQTLAPTAKIPANSQAPAVNPHSPLPNICLPCATPEGEPYITENGIDVTNPGCLEPGDIFTDINLDQAFCGNTNSYLYLGVDPYRDLDWYRVVLTSPATLYWSVYADFLGELYITSSPCANFSILNADYAQPGVSGISSTLPAGTYYLIYTTSDYLGNGVGYPYMVKVSTSPPGDPSTWCTSPPIPTLSQWGLIILGITLLAFGSVYILRWNGASA